jgi:hypothetical protein
MNILHHTTKIIILPYNSIDVRDEIKEFDIELDNKLKKKFGIEKVSFLKKDQFSTPKKGIHKMMPDRTLYVSQNSISSTLRNFEKERVCIIFIPGKYNIEKEIINAESIEIYTLSDNKNHPIINISSDILLKCKYFSANGVHFITNKDKDKYFNNKYSTYSGLIFTEKSDNILFSNCIFENNIESKNVLLFKVKEGAEQVNINDCKFNNSNYEIENVNMAIFTGNEFNSTDMNIRFSNSMFHRNNFNGSFRLGIFDSHLVQINNNTFDNVENNYYLINADYKSALYLTNNKITTATEKFNLVNINRHSKCYIDNNNIALKEDQILSSAEFGGELYVSNNTFNKNDIEIAGYDCKIGIEENNKLINSDEELKFFLTERNIIKPSNTYFSFC